MNDFPGPACLVAVHAATWTLRYEYPNEAMGIMVLGSEYLGTSVRIATGVLPVAGYFLVLGLLNSRQHPQLLTARLDFSLLMLAFCPGFVLPTLARVGLGPPVAVVAAVSAVAIILLLAPGGYSWTVYSLSTDQAHRVIRSTLEAMGWRYESIEGGYRAAEPGVTVRVGGFSILRNVSVRLVGGSKALARRFEGELSLALERTRSQTPPMAVAMLLVATTMMVAPLALMAHRVPELVRLLADIW